jgi:hypothetical protein
VELIVTRFGYGFNTRGHFDASCHHIIMPLLSER